MTKLELLAPAKDLACGIAAVDHGADAVYIGARQFGARAAAGNSIDDISQLCQYAHQFSVRVYVTVNTILYDNELDATRQLLCELYEAGVDAILVQDMALLNPAFNLPPVELHASTQTDNRSVEKVRWLHSQGFRRVVLARELSVDEIAEKTELPHEKVDEAMMINSRHVSVDAPFVEGEENSLLDVLVNDDAPMADRQLVVESLRAEIGDMLKTLNERERRVVKAFYGIGEPELTLEEIGNKYGLTRERVRQIKEKAIRRLRNNTHNKILKAYLGQ